MRRSALRRRARKGRGDCSEGWVLFWRAPLSRPHRLARPGASYPSPEYGAGEGAYGGGRRCPTCPPSNVLGNRGTPPVPPAGAAPLHPAWGTEKASLSCHPTSTGGGTRGACWTDGLVVACAVLQRGDWLGLRCCPTGPPSNVFGNRGTPCTPGGGAAPCPLLGERGERCFVAWAPGPPS